MRSLLPHRGKLDLNFPKFKSEAIYSRAGPWSSTGSGCRIFTIWQHTGIRANKRWTLTHKNTTRVDTTILGVICFGHNIPLSIFFLVSLTFFSFLQNRKLWIVQTDIAELKRPQVQGMESLPQG